MNKKANIPIIILVLGVLAVCSLALISFYVSNFKVKNTFVGIGMMEEMHSQIEEKLFEEGYVGEVYIEKPAKKFSPGFEAGEFHLVKEKIIFSVKYSP